MNIFTVRMTKIDRPNFYLKFFSETNDYAMITILLNRGNLAKKWRVLFKVGDDGPLLGVIPVHYPCINSGCIIYARGPCINRA